MAQLKRHGQDRRMATLVATVAQLEATAIDDALDLLDLFMTTELIGKAHQDTDKQTIKAHPRLASAASMLVVIAEVLLEASSWGEEDQDVLVQRRRNAQAAKKFFRKLLKGLHYVPRVLVTDKLGSYQVAHREMLSSVQHHRSKYLHNRAENSHQPTRIRERVMKRFHSGGQAQRFCSAHGVISSHFRPGRLLMSGTEWRTEITERFTIWNEIAGVSSIAA